MENFSSIRYRFYTDSDDPKKVGQDGNTEWLTLPSNLCMDTYNLCHVKCGLYNQSDLECTIANLTERHFAYDAAAAVSYILTAFRGTVHKWCELVTPHSQPEWSCDFRRGEQRETCGLCGIPEGGTRRWIKNSRIVCYCCAKAKTVSDPETCTCCQHFFAREKKAGVTTVIGSIFTE
jgi:hypothetical protein